MRSWLPVGRKQPPAHDEQDNYDYWRSRLYCLPFAALLLQHNYNIKAVDNLDAQIHGNDRRPAGLSRSSRELIVGDIRSPKAVRRALAGVDAVIHLAARVGVGQSMYEVADYTDVNGRGTAILLEAMIERAKRRPFGRLVADLHLDQQGLRRDRRFRTGRAGLALYAGQRVGTQRHRRDPQVAVPQPVWLLERHRRPVRAAADALDRLGL